MTLFCVTRVQEPLTFHVASIYSHFSSILFYSITVVLYEIFHIQHLSMKMPSAGYVGL